MSGETPSINPEDLIVQEGPNKGAINDIELAMKGAEREGRWRDKSKPFIGLAQSPEGDLRPVRLDKEDPESDARLADEVGEDAIKREVERRAEKQSGMTESEWVKSDEFGKARDEFEKNLEEKK